VADGAGLGRCWDHHRPGLRLGRDRGAGLPRIPGTPDNISGSAPATAPRLPAHVGIDASGWPDERLDDVFTTYLTAYQAAWRPFPDAEPCLVALRHTARLAVLSNGDQEQQEEKVSRTGLRPYLDTVLTSDQLGVAKPDPRIFALACSGLGVRRQSAVYVGDQLEVDALAATAAGVRGIWLNRKGETVPSGVEAIRNLADLPGLLADAPVV